MHCVHIKDYKKTRLFFYFNINKDRIIERLWIFSKANGQCTLVITLRMLYIKENLIAMDE